MAVDLARILANVAPLVEGMLLLDTVRFVTPGGPPVFNPDTGQFEVPEGAITYEGPGAVQSGSLPETASAVVATQPWVTETTSKYKAFTPLAAPIAARDTIVTVVSVHDGGDQALVGRQWRTMDPSQAGTLGVIRVTSLDQIQQTGGEA
ncbi:DUF6093 family protein [Streptomyces violaceorubidus]|uniref:DUF6093 family protein n=1 Tax=Streptomyces violaceorubidus TaxID=284042 RepID=UPI0004BF1C51|nr:DUF6093 family protein [Streptomyces violaceorubidus]